MRLLLLLTLFLSLPCVALADDRILLAEILPALAGTDLGALPLGAAPPPGTSRLVHRGEVLAAFRAAHRTSVGLAIPGVARVTREAHVLDADAITALARTPLHGAVGACRVSGIRSPPRIILPTGPITSRVEVGERVDTGPTAVTLLLEVGTQLTRIPLQVTLVCPPPVIAPGQRIRLIVRVGAVLATAPGEARQPGRIGEIIRVTNVESGSALRGRIVASDAVEVVR